jgi:uncharacterized protein involved in exopolysaccharide biosynthesis
MAEIKENTTKATSETDLLEIVKTIWAGRKTIIKTVIVFLVIGVVIVIFSPKKYKSEITLIVETSSSGSGMSSLIQQFGGLAGININKTEKEALTPDLYPEVIQSTPFLLELLQQKVIESKYDSTLSISQYLEHHTRSSIMGVVYSYTLGLPKKIWGWIKKEDETKDNKQLTLQNKTGQDTIFTPIKLTQKQIDLTGALGECIKTEEDFKKSNKFIISVEMQDPLVVAQVTNYVVKNLSRYIIEYRTKKSKTDLAFIQARTEEAEEKYHDAQQALASYKDRNKNVILSSVLTEEEQLQSEYDLAFTLYSALAKQLEQAKIKVQEETPVFNLMDPAQIPLKKSRPKTALTLISMLFLGILFGAGIIYGKTYLQNIRQKF